MKIQAGGGVEQKPLVFGVKTPDSRNDIEDDCDGRHGLIGLNTTFRRAMDKIEFPPLDAQVPKPQANNE